MLRGFCFAFLSDLITSVYICRAAPCFSPSLLVSVSLIAYLACLCGRGLVRANRHALPATLGLAVLPSCLRSNRARMCLLACSSWASLRMIFFFSLLNLISTHTLFIVDQPCWHDKDALESKSIMTKKSITEIQTRFAAPCTSCTVGTVHRRITIARRKHYIKSGCV